MTSQSGSIRDNAFNRPERTEDEKVYLTEDRYNQPKEFFKRIVALIKETNPPEDMAILDNGCATGEFLYYVRTQFPHAQLAGLDIVPSLAAAAQKALPDARFTVSSVENAEAYPARKYDVITFNGSLACLDDPTKAMHNFLKAIKPGGVIVVADAFNRDPIDVLMRYRRADQAGSPWEDGWNIFSRYTMDRIMAESGYKVETAWHDFRMPFPIPRKPDPMRAWTVSMDDQPLFEVNGACQLLDIQIMVNRVKGVPA